MKNWTAILALTALIGGGGLKAADRPNVLFICVDDLKPLLGWGSAEVELYDYETDPLETRNWAAEKPDIVNQMRAMLATQPEAKRQMRGR